MDWDRAIERNREALIGIVSALFALVAAARVGGAGVMLPRRVWLMVLFVLRPAEAAVRRLVVIAARALAPARLRLRAGPAGGFARADVPREPVFHLIDPLRDVLPSFAGDAGLGWEEVLPGDPAFAALPESRFDELLDASQLHLRLRALRLALADLSKQARRLARWTARRDAALKDGRPTRLSPMRPGLPPGWRGRPAHAIDPVLRECHRLARDLLNAPNSS